MSTSKQDFSQLDRIKGAFFKTLFVLTSALLVFESVRNSLTWHLSQFWGGVGDVWQLLWDKLLAVTGEDPFTLEVWGSLIVTNAVFWTVGSIYSYFDVTSTPKFLRKYKIQPGTNEPVDPQKFKHLVQTVFINTFVFGPFFFTLGHKLWGWRGRQDYKVLPEFHTVVLEFLFFLIVEEICFFYSHWALHHRLIYKHIHKKHHEWTASVAFVCLYAHPFEHLMSNLMPVFMGPFLMGSHIATSWLWFSVVLLSTLNAHSGYHFPFFPSPEAHDFHHLKFNQNYGVLGILDYLHGTDVLFRSNKAYQRHIMLVGSTPLRESIPDDGDKIHMKKID